MLTANSLTHPSNEPLVRVEFAYRFQGKHMSYLTNAVTGLRNTLLMSLTLLTGGYWLVWETSAFAEPISEYIYADWDIELWSIHNTQFDRCYEGRRDRGFSPSELATTCKERVYGHPHFKVPVGKYAEILAYEFDDYGMSRLDFESHQQSPGA